jgi:TonB family protein
MSALLSAAQHHLAVWAGWTALVVLWQSLVVALAFAAWRSVRASAGAESQHRAALVALGFCVAGLAVAPALLAWWPAAPLAPVRPAGAFGAARQIVPPPGAFAAIRTALPTGASAPLNAAAGVVGLLWLVGSVALLVRLAGGWWMATRLRGRAVPPTDGVLVEQLRRLGPAAAGPLEVLESREIEAPVVLGVLRPALIVPNDLRDQLGDAALAPLLAHECAHVRRADYAANVAQSVAEAVLFFSPAVHWISRVVRETREYCCDDAAVRWCADDRGGYVRALSGLAALGSGSGRQPVLGAAGPRLVTRVRRLLSEDAMQRASFVRAVMLVVMALCLGSLGGRVVTLSAQQAAGASAGPGTAWNIPIGYATGQPGSSVVLGPVLSDASHLAATITVTNEADVAVSSITLVGIVRGSSENRGPGPLAIVQSAPIAVSVPPGTARTVAARFLSREQLAPAQAKVGLARQVFFGIERVEYANGADWSMAPNPAARTEWEALSLPPAQVSRRLIVATPRVGPREYVCTGENGAQTSEGGVLAVVGEPGRWAVCRNGVWLDYQLDTAAGAPARRPELVMPVAVKEVRPRYPPTSLKSGPQGNVVVDIVVDVNGKVTSTKVVRSLSPELDAEAVKAAKQWEFTPGTKAGVPVEVETSLEFTFTTR